MAEDPDRILPPSEQRQAQLMLLAIIVLVVLGIWGFMAFLGSGSDATLCQEAAYKVFKDQNGRSPTREEAIALTKGCLN